MTETIQRFLWAGVLAIWGVTLAFFYFSGRVSSYLHPSFHLWTAISGIVLAIMAVALLFLPKGKDCCEGDCLHANESKSTVRKLATALILTVPLLVAATVSPNQFGAATITNRGIVDNIASLPGYQAPPAQPSAPVDPPLPTQDGKNNAQPATASTDQSQQDFMPKNAAGQIKAQTVDLLYAAQEPSMRADFENKEVEMIGQFMPARGNNPKGNRFDLVRMFVTCCAADARPVAVIVQAPQAEKLTEMSWVKVVGKATFPIEGGRMTPIVVADKVETCDPPDDTFIY